MQEVLFHSSGPGTLPSPQDHSEEFSEVLLSLEEAFASLDDIIEIQKYVKTLSISYLITI